MSQMSEEAGAELEQLSTAQLTDMNLYDPDLDFEALALEAKYRAKGFRLVKKAVLQAIPFVAIGVTYRWGQKRAGIAGDYVSIEAVVASKNVLNSPQIRAQLRDLRDGNDEVSVYPNEPVVFNDSGTGIRRYFTRLFQEDMGLIDVGPEDKRFLSRYDKQFDLWDRGAELAQTGIVADLNGEPFRWIGMRGLRKSEYTNDNGPATTWYCE